MQHLEIDGSEYAFGIKQVDASGQALPQELHAGWTKVTFHNSGIEAHQVMFAAPRPGVDLAELAQAAAGDSSGAAAIGYVDMLGGVSYVGPGKTVEAVIDLPAGTVMAMCYVPDSAGVAHALSGMTAMLTVNPAQQIGGSDGEPVLGTITMGAAGYELPDSLEPGWYRVVNTDDSGADIGTGLHEMSVMRLDQPLTEQSRSQLLSDLASNATPKVTLDALGGMAALSTGLSAYLYLDLGPGPYLAVDFMPDPGNPRPHLLDGYVKTFEI